MKRLVVTGDDFGRTAEVNRAIVDAHQRGILTAASLMVAAPAAQDAVALARAHPTLAVGLHLVVVDGETALPPEEIPRVAGGSGRFRVSPVRAGLLYQFSRRARRELRREIRGQLERFRQTGLTLSHVDGHHHMHLHPFVLGVLIELAPEFGIPWIRLPSEELRMALSSERGRAAEKILWSAVFGGLRLFGKRRLAAAGIGFAERVYGLLMTGRIHEEYLLHLISHIRAEVAELYCHPGASAGGPEKDLELAALLSERVRTLAARQDLRLATFRGEPRRPSSRAATEAAR